MRTTGLLAMGATAALALATRMHSVQRMDDAVERAVGRRRPRLVRVARVGTLPGERFVHPTMGAIIAFAIVRRRPRSASCVVLPLALASLGAIVAHHAVKLVYPRRRPEIALRRGKVEPAFPSGHTADATAVLATGAYLLVREQIVPARIAIPIASVLAIGTGVSRVVLGWHWTTDVIGGWMTGVGVAAGCAVVYDFTVRREAYGASGGGAHDLHRTAKGVRRGGRRSAYGGARTACGGNSDDAVG